MKTIVLLFCCVVLSQAQLFTSLAKKSGFVVDFTIENLSKELAFVLTWNTPLEDMIREDIFDVSIKGQKATYLGMVARRAEPSLSDYVPIKPGQSLSKTVDLAPLYDFSLEGEYSVQLNTLVWYFTNNDQQMIELVSSPVLIFAANWTAPAFPEIADPFATFVDCTAAQQSTAQSSINTGQAQTNTATNYMQNNRCNGAYVTWFGTVTSTRWQRVTNGFVSVRSAFSTSRFRVNCRGPNCSSGVLAYVYPTDTTQTIYLCTAFYSDSATGRGETMVHELSHFNSIWGTRDHTYGKANCQNLARTNPDNAISNADNVCYFASANPSC